MATFPFIFRPGACLAGDHQLEFISSGLWRGQGFIHPATSSEVPNCELAQLVQTAKGITSGHSHEGQSTIKPPLSCESAQSLSYSKDAQDTVNCEANQSRLSFRGFDPLHHLFAQSSRSFLNT